MSLKSVRFTCLILASIAITSTLLTAVHAQVSGTRGSGVGGTRGSSDVNQGLILQNRPTTGTRGSASSPLLVPTSPTPLQVPTINQIQAPQIVNPQQVESTNARGSAIEFDTPAALPIISSNVTAPPAIVTTPIASTLPTNPENLITHTSATEFRVVPFDPGLGDGMPLVDSAYATMDRGGVIEDTSFGRPIGEIRTATTTAAGEVVTFDSTIVGEGNVSADNAAQIARIQQNAGNKTFVGGIKPGVQAVIPRRKGTPPRRSTKTAASSTQKVTPGTSIFTQKPVQTTPTQTQKPAGNTNFVAGGGLGLEDNPAPVQQATQQTAQVQPPKQENSKPTETKPTESEGLKIRILYAPDSFELKDDVKTLLRRLASQMQAAPDMKIELLSYASGEKARRNALTRALTARAFLTQNGVDSTRMLVKPIGQKNDGEHPDRLEILELK